MDTIAEIVRLEWDGFQAVNNVGGRAACQDDGATFAIMRSSQLRAWLPAVRASYLDDLVTAQCSGRNLMEEKYARMMEQTAPAQYELLKSKLPELGNSIKQLVEKIVVIHMEWQRHYAETYPKLAARGRETDNDIFGTSFETYLRGELLTYSEGTLLLYLRQVQEMQAEGLNLNARVMDFTAQAYGYESAADAENSLRVTA